jgi:hypothetical protein
MTPNIRPAESRLPRSLLPLSNANRKVVRAFWRGAAVFGALGFLVGWWI